MATPQAHETQQGPSIPADLPPADAAPLLYLNFGTAAAEGDALSLTAPVPIPAGLYQLVSVGAAPPVAEVTGGTGQAGAPTGPAGRAWLSGQSATAQVVRQAARR
jgi:hypothetical protein